MPDERITRRKLKDHFRRLWAVYLAGAVLLCFLNNLVYQITRPGFSDDETLKIMLLNTDVSVYADTLLEDVRALGFKRVEELEIAAAKGDPSSEMLLFTQLVTGFADICISDGMGLELLLQRDVCLPLDGVSVPSLELYRDEDGFAPALIIREDQYLVVFKNGTNTQTALAALLPLAENMELKK